VSHAHYPWRARFKMPPISKVTHEGIGVSERVWWRGGEPGGVATPGIDDVVAATFHDHERRRNQPNESAVMLVYHPWA
jgi:hypothetical protein